MTGSLYIHLPFCRRRCDYCDFYSTLYGDGSLVEKTVEQIIKQLHYIADRWQPQWQSIYFGGGTPSLLPFNQLEKLFNAVGDRFTLSDDCEITVEANPESASADFFRFLRSTFINRLSLGIQSFDEEILNLLGRQSDRRTAFAAVERAAKASLKSWSLDFISEIPGAAQAVLQSDLEQALRFRPPHLSIYALSIAENSPLEKRLSGKEVSTAVEKGFDFAEAHGYRRYEVSNCALPGQESRHNRAYWKMDSFWGCGPSGSGTFRDVDGTICRWEGVQPLTDFLKATETVQTWYKEKVSAADYAFENVMMGCRLAEGIDLNRFQEKTGFDLIEMAPKTTQKALSERLFGIKNGRFFPFTDGFRCLNRFLVDFLSEFDKHKRFE